MSNIILFAPHVDDEAIGCFDTFSRLGLWRETTVVYLGDVPEVRKADALTASLELGFAPVFLDQVKFGQAQELSEGDVFVAPDFYFEVHPQHRATGLKVWEAAKTLGKRFWTYSTRMSVPYVQELSPEAAKKKKKFLDLFYASQASLWEHDHRFWLFEGMSEWTLGL